MPHILNRVDVGRHGWPINPLDPIFLSPLFRHLRHVFGVIVLLQFPRCRFRTKLVPGCWQETPLVDVTHSLGVEVLFEADDTTEASARKATPHIDFGGVLHGSDDLFFPGRFQTRPFA